MHKERLILLMEQYLNNTISEADCKELLNHIATADEKELSVIDILQHQALESNDFSTIQAEQVFDKIVKDQRLITAVQTEKRKTIRLTFLKYAAAIVLITTIGLYLYNAQQHWGTTMATVHNSQKNNDKSQISLKTSNGQVVSLDSIAGYLSLNGKNLSLVDSTGGIHEIPVDKEPQNLTLNIPKGATYQVKLADGTNVWLNSASSLTFPSEFNDIERKVHLTGEAYFEVAKHATKRFKVVSGEQTIEVLGTHFNVTAYQGDEHMTTTLLEGAVKIAFRNNQKLLKPGEQALSSSNTGTVHTQLANLNSALAWKNGYFDFQDSDLKTIMEQIERWYDVEVVYQNKMPNLKFGGTFSKSKKLDDLLRHLETLGKVSFKREGRSIIVTG